MSLKAVRHAKQRLAPDPRNLHWANDENKFGLKMMQKMGWAQGKGLGAKEDGVTDHVKVRLKENHLGVGATKKSSDNWLGNTDAFSKLLAELNERVENDAKEDEEKSDEKSSSESSDESEESKSSKKEKKEKKSKKSKDGKEKKDKKDKKDKKEKKDKNEKKDKKEKKSKKSSDDEERSNVMAAINGRKASRHKYLRNKHAALQNSERLNEILGIKSETASPVTSGMSTPVVEEPMTSTDIYAARMMQNSMMNAAAAANGEEAPRPSFGGLGFATSAGLGSQGYNSSGLRGLGFVKATVSVMPATIEAKVEEVTVVEKTEEAAPASEEKKSKKEKKSKEDKESSSKDKKEKKDKKDKKRKSEDDSKSSSKKSKK